MANDWKHIKTIVDEDPFTINRLRLKDNLKMIPIPMLYSRPLQDSYLRLQRSCSRHAVLQGTVTSNWKEGKYKIGEYSNGQIMRMNYYDSTDHKINSTGILW